MKYLLLILVAITSIELSAQFHDDNIPKITSLQAAQEYADRYREVSFGIINAELDVFLFDEVDTSNLGASVGKISTIYRRKTKFLKDTSVILVNVQVIEFNIDMISLDSTKILMDNIIKDYNLGVTLWYLMKEYGNESCKFSGGPVETGMLKKKFGSSMEERKQDEIFKWRYVDKPNWPCLIIIQQKAHSVPAFYSISYNIAG